MTCPSPASEVRVQAFEIWACKVPLQCTWWWKMMWKCKPTIRHLQVNIYSNFMNTKFKKLLMFLRRDDLPDSRQLLSLLPGCDPGGPGSPGGRSSPKKTSPHVRQAARDWPADKFTVKGAVTCHICRWLACFNNCLTIRKMTGNMNTFIWGMSGSWPDRAT